ncbi:hypothetical protein [Veillonella agrestimuris]|uniref:hypothetical protein n=1 Tax=Veillonella agrestimuris TaxID=2941340 RepID=UPI00203FAF88|nr:hypothetical protein [Veillonella agrestimuris]
MFKRMIALSLITLGIGCNPIQALDIDIPGADPTIPVDKYQQYRSDDKIDQELKKVARVSFKERIGKILNIGEEDLDNLVYVNTEMQQAMRFSSTVVILKENGADVKFTSSNESIVGEDGPGVVDSVVHVGEIRSLGRRLAYEVHEQPAGDNWENTDIPYSAITSEVLAERFANRNASDKLTNKKWLGGAPFSYGVLEKASWDVIKYSQGAVMGSINFTLPNTPTRSYHIGYNWDPTLLDLLNMSDSKVVPETMDHLVNIVLPSIKPASDILNVTKPVTEGPYTFRVLKDSNYRGNKNMLNTISTAELYMSSAEMYTSDTIKEGIFKVPFYSDNPKMQNVFRDVLLDFLPYKKFLENKSPIKFATVWNDGIPGLYLEAETADSTFFMIVVYDNKQKYFHFVERLHDSPINREQVRDAVQYIEVKKGLNKKALNMD